VTVNDAELELTHCRHVAIRSFEALRNARGRKRFTAQTSLCGTRWLDFQGTYQVFFLSTFSIDTLETPNSSASYEVTQWGHLDTSVLSP